MPPSGVRRARPERRLHLARTPNLLKFLLLFAGVTVAGLAVAVWRMRRSGWNVLDPTAAFWLGFAAYYGAGNIWFCWDVLTQGVYDSGGFYFDPAAASDVRALSQVAGMTVAYGLSVALGMFWLGRASLAVGFVGAVARKLASGPDLAGGLLVPLCVIYWLGQLGIVPLRGGVLPSGILILPLICCLALNLKLCFQATQQPRSRGGRAIALAIGVLSVSVLCGAAAASKEQTLMPAVAAFAGFMLGVRRPWPIAAAIVIALPAFVVVQTFNKLSRAVIWDSEAKLSAEDRIEAIGRTALAVVFEDRSGSHIDGLNRLCTAVPMMQTLELVRRQDGISFVDGLVVPYIPRAVWPSKPQVMVGNTLYRKFSGDEGGGSSSSPGQPAEAFMYGGWFGVVTLGVGMGLLAAFASSMVQHFWAARKAASLGVVMLMALNFGKCENWLWAYVPSLVNCAVLLIALQLLSHLVSRSKQWNGRTFRRAS